jgi:hypothetical protein
MGNRPEERAEALNRADLPPDPVIEVYKRDVDRTLLRENLKLTVDERFRKLQALQRFAAELRRAGARARQ